MPRSDSRFCASWANGTPALERAHRHGALKAVGMRTDAGLKLLSSHAPPMAMTPASTTRGRVFTNTPSSEANAPSTLSPAFQSSFAALYKAQTTPAMTRASRACFQIGQPCQGDWTTWVICATDQVQII